MYKNQNRMIIIITILIMAIGLSALYSVTYQREVLFKNIFLKQLLRVIIGCAILFLLSNFNYRRFYDFAFLIYGIGLLFLIIVLATGREILGARRWIEFFGINFQPAELVKLGIILALARIFSQRQIYKPSSKIYGIPHILLRDLIYPAIFVLVPMVLIILQPDLGTSLLLLPIFLALLFICEVRIKYIISFVTLLIFSAPLFWHFLRPYQKERLLVFINPNIDPLGAGYTIIQSKIAVGSGGFLGKGWLAGTQNQLNFLPERHTDFIFSVIGEEWGFLGATFLMILYGALIIYSIKIALQTNDKFGRYLSVGFISLFTLQIVINVSMCIGICPVVGLSLPLISYGGSSMFIFLIFIAILLNINKKRVVF
jgi:rod shape determining protein RodA